MRPALPPLAALVPDLDTSLDVRHAARGLAASQHLIEAARSFLEDDLHAIHKALLTPTSRAFRLELSRLLPSLHLRQSAFLSEQHALAHCFGTIHLYLHLLAWHYLALHPTLLSASWGSPSSSVNSLCAAVSARLGTLAPPAQVTPGAPLVPPPAGYVTKLRVSVFLRRAQLTAADVPALHQLLSAPCTGRLSADETSAIFNLDLLDSALCTSWHLPSLGESGRELTIVIHPEGLVAITSSLSLASLVLPDTKASRFLPPEFNWRCEQATPPWWRQREASPPPWFQQKLRQDKSTHSRGDSARVRPLPKFHACGVVKRRERWSRRFGKYLSQATRVILDGKLCLPLDVHDVEPMDRPNLKTCYESAGAVKFVDSIVSEYLVTNVCSWYPPSAPPLCICPIGVVDKNTAPFHRLVIDARGPNAVTSRWQSNMRSLASAAHIFQPGSVCFTFDIVSPYQGCRSAFTHRMRADGSPYVHVGCEPDNCNLACSKGMLGFRWKGQTFAFNAPMFGGKVSGNILDTLLEPFDRWVRAQGIPYLRWVDDLCFAVPPHPEHRHDTSHCGGADSCFMCADTWRRAVNLQQKIADLLTDLGFTLNDKLTPPSQRGEFIGLGWDTLRNTFFIAPGKAEKMATCSADIVQRGTASRRDLAKLRGKLCWFSPCLYGVSLLTRAINAFIGSPHDDSEWDAVVPLPADVVTECLHWTTTLQARMVHERPMWKPSPQQLLHEYHSSGTMVQAYLETDASLHGWGCTLHLLEDGHWETLTTSAPWLNDDPTVQVQCEAEALGRAIATFALRLAGRAVLHATDCAPTVEVPTKGSARSRRLLDTARSIWRLCSLHAIYLTSVWVPGDHMLRSGTDFLSRGALLDPHCARLTSDGWNLILALAAELSFTLGVDLFADAVNHQLDTFWAREYLLGAAGRDALSAPSWAGASCARCHSIFGPDTYIFPPVPLLDQVVAKAQRDGARGILVLPRLINTVWWGVLSAAAVSSFCTLPQHCLDTSREACDPQYSSLTWNYVTFDFGNRPHLTSRPCLCVPEDRPVGHLSSLVQRHEHLHSLFAQSLLQEAESP